jgi:hypothetical protein
VKISRKDPLRVVAAWRDFRTGVTPAVRRVGYSFSTDGGESWATSALLPSHNATYPRTSDPAVGVDTSGNFYIATISITSGDNFGKIVVYKSIDGGVTFDSGSVAPADTSTAFFDDKEYITSDLNEGSPYADRIYISWTRFGSPGGMFLTYSTDEGATWSSHTTINDAGNSGQGSDPCVDPDGNLCVVWYGGPIPAILFDRSTNGGVSFGPDVVVDTIFGSFGGFPSIEADISGGSRNGYLYTAYSDGRNGDLDVFLKSSSNGGATWSAPVRINDDSTGNGKDQYWPWIAVDELGTVAILYYDTRNTPDNTISETYVARSTDGGLSFINELASTAQSPHNAPNGDVRFGDYIGIDAWGGKIIPVWTDERAGGFDMDIYSASIDRDSTSSLAVKMHAGWNMVSLPLSVTDSSVAALFPTAVSSAFAYEGSYVQNDTMRPGRGYWLKFDSPETVQFSGAAASQITIGVIGGWNLIGSVSQSIPVTQVSSVPPGLITSEFFEYNGSYVVGDSIDPGKGYWVKVNQGGELILSSSAAALAAARIRILPTNELPPSAPGDAITSRGSPDQSPIPNRFALYQNYPNPFNPTTVIRYWLPVNGYVTLKVYNLLGQEMITLVDGMQDAGFKRVEWDTRQTRSSSSDGRADIVPGGLSARGGSASGVYFYRIVAGTYSQTKKLLIAK